MRESSVYQAILAEGRQEGRQEGLNEEALKLVLRMLRRRLGLLPSGTIALDATQVMPRELELRLEKLPLLMLEELGEALLEFDAIEDLIHWLAGHEP